MSRPWSCPHRYGWPRPVESLAEARIVSSCCPETRMRRNLRGRNTITMWTQMLMSRHRCDSWCHVCTGIFTTKTTSCIPGCTTRSGDSSRALLAGLGNNQGQRRHWERGGKAFLRTGSARCIQSVVSGESTTGTASTSSRVTQLIDRRGTSGWQSSRRMANDHQPGLHAEGWMVPLAFYETPPAMARWLIAGLGLQRIDKALDPCSGRGVLARVLHQADPSLAVDTIDIDPSRGESGRNSYGGLHRTQDFLAVDPIEASSAYDVISMNPPFVPWHHISAERKKQYGAVNSMIPQPPRPDLWSFFLAHAIRCVRIGGSVRAILPITAVGGGQWDGFLEEAQRHFGRTRIRHWEGSSFKGTAQQVLAIDLDERLEQRQARPVLRTPDPVATAVSSDRFGGAFHVVIGAVIAPKPRLALPESEWLRLGAVHETVPIICSGTDVPVSGSQLAKPTRRVPCRELTGPRARSYIRRLRRDGLHRGHHASRREPWYVPKALDAQPDAVLQYTFGEVHRIALNPAGYRVSNSLLALTVKNSTAPDVLVQAVSNWYAERWQRALRSAAVQLPSGGWRLRLRELLELPLRELLEVEGPLDTTGSDSRPS